MKNIKILSLFLIILLLSSCSSSELDFCKHLSITEAQEFNPSIVRAKMVQTEAILYCVYSDGGDDFSLAITVDRPLSHPTSEYITNLMRGSTEKYKTKLELDTIGDESTALFLGNTKNVASEAQVIGQNSKNVVMINTPEVKSPKDPKFKVLQDLAARVLSRI